MKRRLWSLIASAAIALSMFSAPVTAHSTGTSHYNGTCTSTATTDPSRGFIWERTTGSLGIGLIGARGYIVAQALMPCTNGDTTHKSKSFMLVSLEGTVGGYENLVQVGLMKNNPPDQTYFGYTKYADNTGGNGGAIYQATWADFDGDGDMDTPVGGRTYDFKIVQASNPVPPHQFGWKFSITDTVLQVTVSKWISYTGGYTGSNPLVSGGAWWGCETGTTSNALGNRHTDNNIYMEHAGYLKYNNGGVWLYTQNSDVHDGSVGGSWSSNPSYYEYHQDQNGVASTDRVWCDTQPHS